MHVSNGVPILPTPLISYWCAKPFFMMMSLVVFNALSLLLFEPTLNNFIEFDKSWNNVIISDTRNNWLYPTIIYYSISITRGRPFSLGDSGTINTVAVEAKQHPSIVNHCNFAVILPENLSPTYYVWNSSSVWKNQALNLSSLTSTAKRPHDLVLESVVIAEALHGVTETFIIVIGCP